MTPAARARCMYQRLKSRLPMQDSVRDGRLSYGASESLEPARIYGPAPPNKAGDSKARRLYAVYQRRRNEGNGAVFGATATTCTALRAMTLTQPGLSSGFTQEGGVERRRDHANRVEIQRPKRKKAGSNTPGI